MTKEYWLKHLSRRAELGFKLPKSDYRFLEDMVKELEKLQADIIKELKEIGTTFH